MTPHLPVCILNTCLFDMSSMFDYYTIITKINFVGQYRHTLFLSQHTLNTNFIYIFGNFQVNYNDAPMRRQAV